MYNNNSYGGNTGGGGGGYQGYGGAGGGYNNTNSNQQQGQGGYGAGGGYGSNQQGGGAGGYGGGGYNSNQGYGAGNAGGGGGAGGYSASTSSYGNYGNYGASNATGTQSYGGGGGGGFNLSQGGGGNDYGSGGASGFPRKSRPDQTVRPFTLRQVASATSQDEKVFAIDGHDVQLVTVVAQVKAISEVATSVTYKIHDHSHEFDARLFINPGETGLGAADGSGAPSKTKKFMDAAKEGNWVRITGFVKMYQGRKYISVQSIREVVDYNEIVMHQLQAVAHHLGATRGPSPKQVAAQNARRQAQQQLQQGGAPQAQQGAYGSQYPAPTQGGGGGGGYQGAGAPSQYGGYGAQPQQQAYGGGGAGGAGAYGQQSYQQAPAPGGAPGGGYGQYNAQQQQQQQQQPYGHQQQAHAPPAGGPPKANLGHPVRDAVMSVLDAPASRGHGAVRDHLGHEASRILGRNIPPQELDAHLEWLSTEGHCYSGDGPDHFVSCNNA